MESGYKFQEFYIPLRMMGGLQRYIQERIKPGDFLVAVLQNNLSEACGRADDENLRNLPAYVAYLYNKAPSTCWGSEEKVLAWVNQSEKAQTEEGLVDEGVEEQLVDDGEIEEGDYLDK